MEEIDHKTFVFDRNKTYFLVTEEDIYKLQCVNNCYAQDPNFVEYAFSPFSYGCVYFGGHIGSPQKVIKSVLELKQGKVFVSDSNRGVENLYLLLIKLNKFVDNIDVLDKIKYNEGQKKMYDVGYIKALLMHLKERAVLD